MNYKKIFKERYFKESEEALDELFKTLPKYQRPTCINCKYKLICAGECELTIK